MKKLLLLLMICCWISFSVSPLMAKEAKEGDPCPLRSNGEINLPSMSAGTIVTFCSLKNDVTLDKAMKTHGSLPTRQISCREYPCHVKYGNRKPICVAKDYDWENKVGTKEIVKIEEKLEKGACAPPTTPRVCQGDEKCWEVTVRFTERMKYECYCQYPENFLLSPHRVCVLDLNKNPLVISTGYSGFNELGFNEHVSPLIQSSWTSVPIERFLSAYEHHFPDGLPVNKENCEAAVGKSYLTPLAKSPILVTSAHWFKASFDQLKGIEGYLPSFVRLLVELSDFTATPKKNGVFLNWKTETELDSQGFHIWQAIPDFKRYCGCSRNIKDYTKISMLDKLIPAKGSKVSGAEYSYLDKEAKPGMAYCYALEDINSEGKSKFYYEYIVFTPDGALE